MRINLRVHRDNVVGATQRIEKRAEIGEGHYRVSFRYLMRCGVSASAPRRRLRSAS
jgi:hypothetical protein